MEETLTSLSKLTRVLIGRKSQCLARCWPDTSVPHLVDLSRGCLSVLITWPLASPRASDSRVRETKIKAAVPFIT